MTPEYQFAGSVKYIARPVVIIPYRGQFIIMKSYSYFRDYITTLPSAELADWLEADFNKEMAKHQNKKEAEQEQRVHIRSMAMPDDLLDLPSLSDFTL